MQRFTSKVDRQGRMLIPAKLRQLAGIRPEDELLLFFENGGVTVLTREAALAQIDRVVKARFGDKHSIVEEFLEERHREAQREIEEADRYAERLKGA